MRGVLFTERFMLRQFDGSDVDDLHAMFSDPATNTIGNGPFVAIDQTRSWVAGRERTRSEYGYSAGRLTLSGPETTSVQAGPTHALTPSRAHECRAGSGIAVSEFDRDLAVDY